MLSSEVAGGVLMLRINNPFSVATVATGRLLAKGARLALGRLV